MTTKHSSTCKMAFGRKDATCPRCQELLNGAKPVQWNLQIRQKEEQRTLEAIRNHDCKKSGCGAICTAFQW